MWEGGCVQQGRFLFSILRFSSPLPLEIETFLFLLQKISSFYAPTFPINWVFVVFVVAAAKKILSADMVPMQYYKKLF